MKLISNFWIDFTPAKHWFNGFLFVFLFSLVNPEGVKSQSLVGTWICNKTSPENTPTGYYYYNNTYVFSSNNKGTYTSKGYRNGVMFLVSTEKFKWERKNNAIEFYTTDYTNYWVDTGVPEKDTEKIYKSSSDLFRFEGNDVMILGPGNQSRRWVRQ